MTHIISLLWFSLQYRILIAFLSSKTIIYGSSVWFASGLLHSNFHPTILLMLKKQSADLYQIFPIRWVSEADTTAALRPMPSFLLILYPYEANTEFTFDQNLVVCSDLFSQINNVNVTVGACRVLRCYINHFARILCIICVTWVQQKQKNNFFSLHISSPKWMSMKLGI